MLIAASTGHSMIKDRLSLERLASMDVVSLSLRPLRALQIFFLMLWRNLVQSVLTSSDQDGMEMALG